MIYQLNYLHNFFSAYFYSSLTYKSYLSKLKTLSPESKVVAVGASLISGNPIGLGLAEIQDNKSAKILSVFVKPQYQRQKIATALLTYLEKELVSRGCTSIEIVYTTGKSTTIAINKLLKKFNWDTPKPRMLVCKTTYDMVNAPWMKLFKLPNDYEIFPWLEITDQERKKIIQTQELEQWIPSDLVPFQYEKNLETINSMGLRYRGEVVGWLITHRHDPDTIRYTCSYVRPDLQKRGRILPLYIKATQIQVEAQIPFVIWTVPLEHESMLKFVKKYMKPYMISMEYSMGTSKLLLSDKKLNDLVLSI
ncbi:MAG: GNAT family N-acetyltransferase [Cyanobacteria bacterium P01_A01_bin.84]